MSDISMKSVKEKYENGKRVVCDAMDTAKNISIHPKLNASLSVKSKDDGESYFDGKIRVDKEFSLLKLIYMILAVIAVFAAAAIIVEAVFSLFSVKKKCKKSLESEASEVAED